MNVIRSGECLGKLLVNTLQGMAYFWGKQGLKLAQQSESYWHHPSGGWCWLEPGWEYWKLLDLEYIYIYIYFSVKNHWMNQRGDMRIWKTMTLELHCACSREVSDRTQLSFLNEWATLQIKAIVLRQTKKKKKNHNPPQ